jgi:hypothetical protein
MLASSFTIVFGQWSGFTMGYNAVGIPAFLESPDRPFDFTIHEKALFGESEQKIEHVTMI